MRSTSTRKLSRAARNRFGSIRPRTRRAATPPDSQPFADFFSAHAALYARARPSYPESLIAEIAALAPGNELAWDVGTGNGQAAGQLAGHFNHVHATDASADQIAHGRAHPHIDFAVEPAENSSLTDSSCDLVLAAESLHWFDLDRFFAEAQRVLKPGGVLAAIGYVWFYVDPVVDEIIGRALIRQIEPLWKPGHWLLHDGYKTIQFPDGEIRINPCAIHLMWTREQLEAFVMSWSPVQRMAPEQVAEAFAELAGVWPDNEPRHVSMPVSSRVCRL